MKQSKIISFLELARLIGFFILAFGVIYFISILTVQTESIFKKVLLGLIGFIGAIGIYYESRKEIFKEIFNKNETNNK